MTKEERKEMWVALVGCFIAAVCVAYFVMLKVALHQHREEIRREAVERPEVGGVQ